MKTSLVLTILAMVSLLGCDSNTVVSTTTDPNISDPSNDVAVNVGPVEAQVTSDVLTKANSIRESVIDNIQSSETETGTAFIRYIIPDTGFTTTIDLGESESCDEGGSKTIIGSVTLTLDDNQSTGTVVGSYTIQYDSCQEIVLLSASDTDCSARPTIDGEIVVTYSEVYNLTEDLQDLDVDDETDVSASTNSALSISVGSTASNQDYSFSYSLSSSSNSTGLSGTATFQSLLYSLTEVESFVGTVSSSVLCP